MKRLTARYTAIISIALLPTFFNSEARADPPAGSHWQMVWNDEFNGTSVDESVWNYWLPGQTRRSAVNQPSNTYVGNGNLTVRITDSGGQLTAGGLQSKMGFGYGYYEVRAQVQGGWATFWLQSPGIDGTGSPAADGTEMDIQEACCPGNVQHAVHWNGYGSAAQFVAQPISTSLVSNQQDFNVYGLEWTADSYKFWVNGQLSWTFTTAISQRSDEFIRLTQETNGDFCGSECLYNVDYVRAYKNLGPDTSSGGSGGVSSGGTSGAGGSTTANTGGASNGGSSASGGTRASGGVGATGGSVNDVDAAIGAGGTTSVGKPRPGSGPGQTSIGQTTGGVPRDGGGLADQDGGRSLFEGASTSGACSVSRTAEPSYCGLSVWSLGLALFGWRLQVRRRAPRVSIR